jgi:hypothetical protein
LQSFARRSFYLLSLTNIGTVIGESIVTPSSILLVKLRISSLGVFVAKKELSIEETKRLAQATAKEDKQLLSTRQDAEDLDAASMNGFAHAPHWPRVSSTDTFTKLILIYVY